jgi:hypothetical protein
MRCTRPNSGSEARIRIFRSRDESMREISDDVRRVAAKDRAWITVLGVRNWRGSVLSGISLSHCSVV